ncbi:MAG: GDP-mannose 4,6-dehydratase [Phycisphaerales bacterium]
MFSSARIAVTGSAGFIGSHLCQALLGRGASVVGIDNMDPYYPLALKRANLAEINEGPGGERFTQHEMDICDTDALTRVLKDAGVQGVIHLAAKAGVRPSIADPVAYARVNVVGTQSVLRAAHEAGCRQAVCASSSSVYGNNKKVPFSEDDPVEQPISPYAATKLGCELIGRTHHHLTGMPTAMLRFFTVFGPRQRPDLAISLFLDKVSRGEAIDRYGDGTSSRDYTYINDIIAGVLSAYSNIDVHGFRVWNLGGDHPTTLNELISAVESVVDRAAVINEMGMQPGDVERTWADLTRAGAELGYAPSTAILEGIAHQWAWMQRLNDAEGTDTGARTP